MNHRPLRRPGFGRSTVTAAVLAACALPAYADSTFWNPTLSDANDNVAAGSGAIQQLMGFRNTAIGDSALGANGTGLNNTGVGSTSLSSNTAGSNNTAVGRSALSGNTAGSNNTAVGHKALQQSAGNNNLGLGQNAGSALTSGNNNVYIANQGGAIESNTMRIGGVQTATFIAGVTNQGAIANAVPVVINSATGQLGMVASSLRYKDEVRDMADQSARLQQLRPVTFHYRADPAGRAQYGLIAEEVDKVYPELVAKDAQGRPESVQYHELVPMLLKQVQEQQEQIAALNARLAKLEH